MKNKVKFLSEMLLLAVTFSLSSCSSQTTDKPDTQDKNPANKDAADKSTTDKSAENKDNDKKASSQKKKMSQMVSLADLKKITGVEFESTSNEYTFKNLSSCEYYSKSGTMIIVVASGTTATKRMDTNRRYPKLKKLAGLGDEALWNPASKNLSVLSNGNCVDIKIPSKLGDDQKLIEIAKKIVMQVLEKY